MSRVSRCSVAVWASSSVSELARQKATLTLDVITPPGIQNRQRSHVGMFAFKNCNNVGPRVNHSASVCLFFSRSGEIPKSSFSHLTKAFYNSECTGDEAKRKKSRFSSAAQTVPRVIFFLLAHPRLMKQGKQTAAVRRGGGKKKFDALMPRVNKQSVFI